jgi:hypothetical protein
LQIETERARVLAMNFKEFMVELRAKMLPIDWERAARLSMLARRQGPHEAFDDFATNVRSQNSLLSGTASHLSDDRLRLQLESAMLHELQEDYETDAVAKHETDFSKWLTEVKRVDATRIRANARYLRMAADDRKRNASNDNNERPQKRTNNRENQPPHAPSSSTVQTGGTARGRCPKLTPTEQKLLDDNYGCRHCRKPYALHHSFEGV